MRGRGLGIMTLIIVFIVGFMVDVENGNAGKGVPTGTGAVVSGAPPAASAATP